MPLQAVVRPFHWLAAKKEPKNSILQDNPRPSSSGRAKPGRRLISDYSMNNPAIKRLAKELQEIQQFKRGDDENFEESDENDENCIVAAPLKDDLFEWHFTLKGPSNSVYSEGRYHGRILFPSDYPFSPPSISFFTPNGRWEVDKKICLSVTGFHPEMWQPAWGIRTILLALRDHFTVDDKAAIGYLDYSPETRKELAQKSNIWKCKFCSYDASAAAKLEDSIDENEIKSSEKSEEFNLFWIGAILLIFSIATSYIYLYLT